MAKKKKFNQQPQRLITEVLYPDGRLKRRRVQTKTVGFSKADKDKKDRCDINKIIAKARSLDMPLPYEQDLHYGDFTSGEDFHSLNTRIAEARTDFYKLPAETREYFKNNPENLIDFMEEPGNLSMAIKLGLVDPKKAIAEKSSQNDSQAVVKPDNPVVETEKVAAVQ